MAGSREKTQLLIDYLSKFKQHANASFQRLEDRNAHLERENQVLKLQLQQCLDKLDEKHGELEQLKMKNARKQRVDERNDWKGLVETVQRDRTILQEENDHLEAQVQELLRCLESGDIDPQEPQEQAESPSLRDPEPLHGRSSSIPSTPTTPALRTALRQTREQLENERAILETERREASRLRRELAARDRRELEPQRTGLGRWFASILTTHALPAAPILKV